MRIWLDTEFQEDGRCIDLISIALVGEDDRRLHLASSDYDESLANDWLRQNVLQHLAGVPRLPRAQIRDSIIGFVGAERPEFWAYFGEYDWIVLRQLFGDMFAWPQGWPLLCMDVEQWRLQLDVGDGALPPQLSAPHDALNDAIWTRLVWQHLRKVEDTRHDPASRAG